MLCMLEDITCCAELDMGGHAGKTMKAFVWGAGELAIWIAKARLVQEGTKPDPLQHALDTLTANTQVLEACNHVYKEFLNLDKFFDVPNKVQDEVQRLALKIGPETYNRTAMIFADLVSK